MNVTVSVMGRFHAFRLAAALAEHGHLAALISSYPAFEVARYGVPRERARPILAPELAARAWQRLPRAARGLADPIFALYEWFDRSAARRVPAGTELFVGWSSQALHSIRRLKPRGVKTVVERGSSHIVYQQGVLAREYERLGLPAALPHPSIVTKELAEYQEADYIAIPSSFVRRSFLAHGVPEAKLIQVPYGVDLDAFHPAGKEDDVFRVIHCGALSVRKGVHLLLQAFHELRLPRAELWLIGGVSDEIRPFLARYASPAIVVKGPVPERDLYRYYSQASVFCLASIEEGLAMVQPQAMACSLPLVCTSSTGVDDLIRDGAEGFVVPPGDVAALQEKLLYCYLHTNECAEMGRLARQRVLAGFTWADYGRKMIAEYQRILAA